MQKDDCSYQARLLLFAPYRNGEKIKVIWNELVSILYVLAQAYKGHK